VKRIGVKVALLAVVASMVILVLVPTGAIAKFRPTSLSEVASAFASRPVSVECRSVKEDSIFDWAWGYVWAPTSRSTVTYIFDEACVGALAIGSDISEITDFMKAIGAEVLVHEAYHLKRVPGNQNEALTECRAMRHYDVVLRMLGASDATMDRLMPIMLINHLYIRSVFPEYNLEWCRIPVRYDRWRGNPPRAEDG